MAGAQADNVPPESGQGRFVFPSGDVYVGNFQNSLFHGEGTITWANGNSLTGLWDQGKNLSVTHHDQIILSNFSLAHSLLGRVPTKGTYTFLSGDVYVGELKDGDFNGYGVYTFENQNTYDGL